MILEMQLIGGQPQIFGGEVSNYCAGQILHDMPIMLELKNLAPRLAQLC